MSADIKLPALPTDRRLAPWGAIEAWCVSTFNDAMTLAVDVDHKVGEAMQAYASQAVAEALAADRAGRAGIEMVPDEAAACDFKLWVVELLRLADEYRDTSDTGRHRPRAALQAHAESAGMNWRSAAFLRDRAARADHSGETTEKVSLSSLRGMAAMPAGESSESIVERSRAEWGAPPPAEPVRAASEREEFEAWCCRQFPRAEHGDAYSISALWAAWQARAALSAPQPTPAPAVAVQPLTPCAFRLDRDTTIEGVKQMDGSTKWAVRAGGNCLNRSGEWEWEPIPSSREDDFLARCRFDTPEQAAAQWSGIAPAGQGEQGNG